MIGSNFSSFNATCVPGSIMRSRIPAPAISPWSSQGSITMGSFSTNIYAIEFDLVSVSQNILADVPYRVITSLVQKLEEIGARRENTYTDAFFNCTRELVVASLPPIEIRKEDLGTLLLYPDEYIEFESDGHCSHLLGSANGRTIFRVDMMRLPNINVRISNSGIVEFCDAMFDPDYVGRHLALMTNMSRLTEEPVQHSSPPTAPPTQSRMQRFAGYLHRFLACLRIF